MGSLFESVGDETSVVFESHRHGKLVSSWSHQSPDLCCVFVQKCHFGALGLNILGRLTGREKVDLWSLLSRSGMKRPVCLKVIVTGKLVLS